MFGHDDIPGNEESIPYPDFLQGGFKKPAGRERTKIRLPLIATEGNKVQIARLLVSLQSPRHISEYREKDPG